MLAEKENRLKVQILTPHENQQRIKDSLAKRKIIKAGRRSGKTVGAAIIAIEKFLEGRRVLYGAPTIEQIHAFWYEVTLSLAEPVLAGVFRKNEAENFIERAGTENRLKAKTVWNANTLRGDWADLLILDEFQLMAEDTWDEVGAPMLLDNNGDAIFIFTPPSLYSSGVSRARDPRHSSKKFKEAEADKTGLWEAFHFTSLDNPYISQDALGLITKDMSLDSYRREIMAEDEEIELSWLVYSKFNESICKIPRFLIPKEWLIYSGHDFGPANPAALFLAQNPGTGEFFIFREYCPGAGYSTDKHVNAFKRLVRLPGERDTEDAETYNVIRRVGGAPQENDNRELYAAHGWPITAPKIERVNAQIDRVIGLMELNKVFIFNDLYNLLNQIANCMWELDSENKPTKNKVKDEHKYHLLACLRYIGSEFVPETVKRLEKAHLYIDGRQVW